MAETPNMLIRDPNDMNKYLNVEYEKIFSEPTTLRSADRVWANSARCFWSAKRCLYVMCTFFIGIISALLWGCIMACLSYASIWYMTPWVRYVRIQLYPIKKMNQIFLATFYAPFVVSCSYFLKRVQITYSESQPRKRLIDFSGV